VRVGVRRRRERQDGMRKDMVEEERHVGSGGAHVVESGTIGNVSYITCSLRRLAMSCVW
jgi:hypothetical protein